MPYQSDAQRRFMHARHPEIAAKWDAEIRSSKKRSSPKKGKIAKASTKKVADVLGTGVDVGKTALQQNTRIRRRKRGRVSKAMAPRHPEDPFFNQEAADRMFSVIMKMDDDTAEMFCAIVAADLLEQEVENNTATLQKHLDEVIAKRTADLKKATLRLVSKGNDVLPYAQTLAMLEAVSKSQTGVVSKTAKDDDDNIPNWEFERKIRRDPQSGRFQMKVHNKPMGRKPIDPKTWEAVTGGHGGANNSKYKRPPTGMGKDEHQLRFQSQYKQVADFLQAVNLATDNDARVLIHYKDVNGNTWVDEHPHAHPPVNEMLTANQRVTGVEALPGHLTHGGAAFSLAGAMGQPMSPDQIKAINTLQDQSAKWSKDWTQAGSKSGDYANSNARLYARTATLGEIAGKIAPEGSKLQLAGAMADIVGQYGPQAEAVIGPSARKTAYRYRGTEKTPDKRLVEMYGHAVEENKRRGPLDPWTEQEANRIRTARGMPKQPYGSETGVRGGGGRPGNIEPETPRALHQMVAERVARANRPPEWQERELGRHAVSQYLTDRLPSKKLYKLQLAAGHTPPSEGVIINSNGQIVTQAVGYADDHYLPFNLKNLKGLKGGEYIRSRSVGGLTAEDVYTGLATGARRVTVVSRSGTFTMEFQPDFRGGRRHNDKARRMTRRYEQILDAVQSEQVERQDVPKRWKDIIAQEVHEEYGEGANKQMVRSEIDARIDEFKKDPKIEGRDLDRAEAEITRMEEGEKRGLYTRQEVADYRKEVMDELFELKEIHFRLNGVGYAAALDALAEQFPYYIHAQSRPKREQLTGGTPADLERDRGYVEPGRNRPTKAQAGWYGTAGREKSGKFSAAHADYQRGLPGAPEPPHGPGGRTMEAEEGESSSSSSSSGGTGGYRRSESERAQDKAVELREERQRKTDVKEAAIRLQKSIKSARTPAPGEGTPPWWTEEESDFRNRIDDDDELGRFDDWVQRNSDALAGNSVTSSAWTQYDNAKRKTGTEAYDDSKMHRWPGSPYRFDPEAKDNGPAYRPSPPAGAVGRALAQINSSDRGLVLDKPLGEHTLEQLRTEFQATSGMSQDIENAKLTKEGALKAFGGDFANPHSGMAAKFFGDKDFRKTHLRNLHKVRYLLSKSGTPPSAGPSTGSSSGGSGGGGSTGGAPRSSGPDMPADPQQDQASFEIEMQSWIDAARKVAQADHAHNRATATFVGDLSRVEYSPTASAKLEEIANQLPPTFRAKVKKAREDALTDSFGR